MGKQIFEVELHTMATIELDDEVIKAGASDDFYEVMGYRMSPQEVADHIVYQKIFNGASLSQLDGFADQPNSNAKILNEDTIK
jgi:hypothetical protein